VPDPLAHGRADSLIEARRFQLLRLDVEIRADPLVRAGVEFLSQSATHPFAAEGLAVYQVSPGEDGSWTVSRDGIERGRMPGPDAAVDSLFAAVNGDALTLWPDCPVLRGAVGTLGGRRFLLIGRHGTGLTSLAVRLLFGGAQLEGDAFAVLTADGLIPVPRRFVLRRGADALLPEVSGMLDGLPALDDGGGGRIWGLDLTEAGFDWRLQLGPVDVCVAVEPNHGGRSRAFPEAHHEMARELIGRCSRPPHGGTDWIRRATVLADGAACWRLQLGRLDEAVACLRSLV
jgi:hypothetical protein